MQHEQEYGYHTHPCNSSSRCLQNGTQAFLCYVPVEDWRPNDIRRHNLEKKKYSNVRLTPLNYKTNIAIFLF